MSRTAADRLLPVGLTVISLGGAAVIARLVFVSGDDRGHFWGTAGYAGIGLLILGLVIGGYGLFAREAADAGQPRQEQRSGGHSVNLQAGRDLHLGDD